MKKYEEVQRALAAEAFAAAKGHIPAATTEFLMIRIFMKGTE
jgi:hypothetical protein